MYAWHNAICFTCSTKQLLPCFECSPHKAMIFLLMHLSKSYKNSCSLGPYKPCVVCCIRSSSTQFRIHNGRDCCGIKLCSKCSLSFSSLLQCVCLCLSAVLKITGGHRSISDQFAHMTAQLALEPVIWSDHSLWLYCSIN